MKPRTQLRFLSIALFALWGRASADDLPPFVVSPALLGKPPAARTVPRAAVTPAVPAAAARPAPPSRVRPAAAASPAPVSAATPRGTSISAERVSGRQDVDAVAEGKATLLREADHLVIVVPYSAESHHLVGAAELALMKPTATLTNIARGGIVDDAALAAAVPNAGLSAWLSLEYAASVRPGQTVVVLGATGVTGSVAVQLAKARFGAGS